MKYLILFGIFSLTILQGCKKEDSCPTLPGSSSIFGYNFKVDSPFLAKPYFNPNNPDEFLFVEVVSTGKLYTYNLVTGVKTLIFEGNILFPPKWSRKDWILLNLSDANIWKIKSNGDSLTQLTFNGSNYYGEWNTDGNRFVFQKVINSDYKTLIADENGVVLDTLSQSVSARVSWQNPKYLVTAVNTLGIIAIDSSFNTTKSIVSVEESEVDGVFVCNTCSNIIWCSHGKIYSTDINSLKTATLYSACLTVYLFPSTNGSKILVQRVQNKYLGNNVVETTSKLVLLNLDGNNEKEIQIN